MTVCVFHPASRVDDNAELDATSTVEEIRLCLHFVLLVMTAKPPKDP